MQPKESLFVYATRHTERNISEEFNSIQRIEVNSGNQRRHSALLFLSAQSCIRDSLPNIVQYL